MVHRAPFYWEVVANAFVGKSRAFAHRSSMPEASIAHYRIEAVLDTSTTPILPPPPRHHVLGRRRPRARRP
jgi:hypothetical protein